MAGAMRFDDKITIAGTTLGGITNRNDASITVNDISTLNETTTALELASDAIDRSDPSTPGGNCGQRNIFYHQCVRILG